jgi:hypothetical protein
MVLKIIWVLGLLAHNAAEARSINPERTVTPLLDILSPRVKKLAEDRVQVPVTSYNSRGELRRNGGSHTLDIMDFNHFKSQASAVYQMVPASLDHQEQYAGTAFHIGHNLVLTNAHVLDPSFNNLTHCGRFRLRSHSHQFIGCKQVHFCSKEHDICLIEMQHHKRHALSTGSALRIKAAPFVSANFDEQINKTLSAIGNSKGLGVHFGQGRGYSLHQKNLYFYAPLRPGNSGGPVLNESGEVVGVVKRESAEKVGRNAYNIATPSDVVVAMIQEALINDPDTLEKFQQSVIE